MGYVAVLADCGAAVLQKLKPDIDMVLLDVLMPGIDGFETVRRLRRDPAYRDLPVIMVTALTGKEDRLAAGANDFIAKPIDRTELKLRMDSLLRMNASQDEVKRYQASL